MWIRLISLISLAVVDVAFAGAQPSGLVGAAKGLFERRKFDEAESILRRALFASPLDPEALVLLGRLRATTGKLEEAESLYRRALRASPTSASAHHALAKLLAFQQRWKEAKGSFEQSLELDAGNAEGWLGLGRVSMATGSDDDAGRHYARSLSLDPLNALLHFDMGVLSCKRGQADAADAAFARAAQLNPNLDLSVVAQMFTAYDMLENARETYMRVLQQEPNNPSHFLAYGELCEALKYENDAKKAYDEALRLDPGMGKAHLRKALLLVGTGITNQAALHACGLNAEEAKRHFRTALASGDEGVARPAADALEWCEMEEREAAEWRRVVREELNAPAEEGGCVGGVGNGQAQDNRLQAGATGEGGGDSAGEQGGGSREDARRRAGGREERERAGEGEGGGGGGGGGEGEQGEEEANTSGRLASAWVDELGGYLSLPEVEISSAEEFMRRFVNKSRPAVIKNFQEDFAPKEAWSWAALEKRFGDSLVRVSLSETGRFDGPEPGHIWGLDPSEEVLVRPPTTSMGFSDFVRLLRERGLKETFYLEYLALHQYLGAAVTDMIPLPAAVSQSGLELLVTNLWLGKGGTTAVLHYDDYENLLCQVRGTKELVLFPPSDLENLYYIGRRKGKLKYEFPGKWTRDELDGSHTAIFGASVRLDDPDFDRHPRLKRCRPYRVVLHAGDVLYMPAFWHHEVRSYPDEDDGNLAVNFWFRNVTSFAEVERDVLGIGA